MTTKSISASIASNRKIIKAARVFAESAVTEIAWTITARQRRKLKRETMTKLREHITAIVILNAQSLAEALAEDKDAT